MSHHQNNASRWQVLLPPLKQLTRALAILLIFLAWNVHHRSTFSWPPSVTESLKGESKFRRLSEEVTAAKQGLWARKGVPRDRRGWGAPGADPSPPHRRGPRLPAPPPPRGCPWRPRAPYPSGVPGVPAAASGRSGEGGRPGRGPWTHRRKQRGRDWGFREGEGASF